MRALKMSSWQQSEIDNNQLRAIIKDDPLTTKQEVAEKLNINYSMVIWHLKHIGQVKKISISGCLMSWPQTKKSSLWSVVFFYSMQQQQIIWIGLWFMMKCGFYMTIGDDQLSDWTEKNLQSTSQGQTCTNQGHGHCLVVYYWSDPLQLSESWQNHCVWEVCSANWWNALKTAWPAASSDQQKGSNPSALPHMTAHHRTIASKVGRIELRSLALPAIFTWPLATSSSLMTTFCTENSSITSRRQKMLSKSSSNPEAQIFSLLVKQTYFSLSKMWWLQGFD